MNDSIYIPEIIDILINLLSYKNLLLLLLSSKNLYNIKPDENYLETKYFTPKSKNELLEKINLWNINKIYTKKKYGDISRWNTKYITDMSRLFINKFYINDNIGDWIVNNVESPIII